MEKVVGKTFRNERINLDYSIYERCSFINCELVTESGIFSLANNDLSGCRLNLGGAARNIAMLIKMFYPDMPIWFEPDETKQQILQKMKERLQKEGLI
jgi:hypothetical protein